jgi:hypothetical protein
MQRSTENYDRVSNDRAKAEEELQRAVEDNDRLSNDIDEVEQEVHLFNKVDALVGNMEIDG